MRWALPLILGACSSLEPSGSSLPPGATPLVAPAIYQDWFVRTESCSGLAGKFSSVVWYMVPGVRTFPTEAGDKIAMWERAGQRARIVIAGDYLEHEMVVRHELLHHLLGREGHPTEYFTERCRLTWETWTTGAARALGGLD